VSARIVNFKHPRRRAFSAPPDFHEKSTLEVKCIKQLFVYNGTTKPRQGKHMLISSRLLFTDHLQKRKLNSGDANKQSTETVDTSRPSAVFKPKNGRKHTLSLALPGSIIAK
jgi:hypothetical protein